MIFSILIVCMLSVYLAVEERERRVANPNSAGWWVRVQKNGKRKLWYVVGTLVGFGVQLVRKKDFQDTLMLGSIAIFFIIFVTLHEATLELPRKDKAPNQ